MKKIIYLFLLSPFFIFCQEELTLENILTINSKNTFLRAAIENGYSEGNSTKDKIYYGKGLSKDKTKATDWAEYTTTNGEFYFEQSNLTFVRKQGDCYYDAVVADIKKQCEFSKIAVHEGKNGDVNFTTYVCPGSKYKGLIGFAQVQGNGVVQLFSK